MSKNLNVLTENDLLQVAPAMYTRGAHHDDPQARTNATMASMR
jgi:hypothetical protein